MTKTGVRGHRMRTASGRTTYRHAHARRVSSPHAVATGQGLSLIDRILGGPNSEQKSQSTGLFKVRADYKRQPAAVDELLANHGLSVDALTDEIRRGAQQNAAEGRKWYPHARKWAQHMARETGHSEEQVIGVISAVSPRVKWNRNQVMAEAVLRNHRKLADLPPDDAAKRLGLGMRSNVATAIRIARGERIDYTLTGPKRQSFFNNIARPGRTDDVTVDGWMAQALTRASGGAISPQRAQKLINSHGRYTAKDMAGYTAIAEATRRAAKQLRIPIDAAQAAYWITVRGNSE